MDWLTHSYGRNKLGSFYSTLTGFHAVSHTHYVDRAKKSSPLPLPISPDPVGRWRGEFRVTISHHCWQNYAHTEGKTWQWRHVNICVASQQLEVSWQRPAAFPFLDQLCRMGAGLLLRWSQINLVLTLAEWHCWIQAYKMYTQLITTQQRAHQRGDTAIRSQPIRINQLIWGHTLSLLYGKAIDQRKSHHTVAFSWKNPGPREDYCRDPYHTNILLQIFMDLICIGLQNGGWPQRWWQKEPTFLPHSGT